MSCTIAADHIIPKNATSVIVGNANVIPTTVSAVFSGAASEAGSTVTCTSYAVGKIVEISVPQISFTGSAAALIGAGGLATFTAPAQDCYIPIEVSVNGTKATGLVLIATTKILTFYSSATLGTFSATPCIIYPCVLHYTSA